MVVATNRQFHRDPYSGCARLRLCRGVAAVLLLARYDYVRVLWTHPVGVRMLSVAALLTIGNFLSFLGIGIQPPEITWGLMIAQIAAVVLGAMVVTSEYGTGMIRATFAATPSRGAVLAAKALVLTSTLFVVGTATAFAGYLGGNPFLENEGVGVALGDDGVLRAMFGSGLYMAGLGLFAAAVGLLVRHTAAALSIVLGLVFVVGNMVFLLPGNWGEWIGKLMPGNAGSPVASAASFNPMLLDPWVGFAVFVGEVAVVLLAGYLVLRRRDA